MKRTRKWIFVSQEATRLAGLGLSPKNIAARLGVNKSSVTRWMQKGKIAATRQKSGHTQTGMQPSIDAVASPKPPKTPSEWAKDIRDSYDLDATDDQLVMVAESSLALSLDSTAAPSVRLQAAGRFQSIVKQLALVARTADAAAAAEPEKKPSRHRLRVVRRPSGDPRRALMAASE